MHPTWDDILKRLKSYPDGVNHLLGACPEDRLLDVQSEIGIMPEALVEMVRRINGAELFVNAIPLVTLFGISPFRATFQIDWRSDWYIDKYTRIWRVANTGSDEWAFAIMNYGGLMLANHAGKIREWDTNASRWVGPTTSIGTWMEKILEEGRSYMIDES